MVKDYAKEVCDDFLDFTKPFDFGKLFPGIR